MNNFGVIEVANTKARHAPGWAYVPDSAPYQQQAQQPTSRKNRAARNQGNPGLSDLSARQDAKLRKELEALDKEPASRDVGIPVRSGGGRSGKHTPNVRKILQSQKTFGNHLDDYLALGASESTPGTGTGTPAAAGGPTVPAAKRSGKASVGKSRAASASVPTPTTKADTDGDISMLDAEDLEESLEQLSYPPDTSILPAYARLPPTPHPGDTDPLLISRAVPFPTDAELRALLTAPPLSYLEARAGLDGEVRAPARKFCEVCGYWGRVKCGKCGGRVCALDCLETHKEECVRRYGL
jgi:zinc finger HIT domain-containing protein 1